MFKFKMMGDNSNIFKIDDNFKRISDIKSILIKPSEVQTPDITIFVPTYRRTFTLRETLDSILELDGDFQYEILLLDNNPNRNDETELLVKEKYNDIPQLSYYKNTKNIGMTGNWNRGYELARSEWVAMLHDDDCLFQDSLYKAMYIIKTLDNKVDALFLNHIFEKKNISRNSIGHIIKLSLFDFYMDNCGTVVGTLMKKQCVKSLGGFSDEFYPAADYHFWAKITKYKTTYRVIDIPCAYYRLGENTSCNTSIIEIMIKSAVRIQKGILYNMSKNFLIRFIGEKKIEYWSLNYLYAWKNTFSNLKNVEDVNKMIDSAQKKTSYFTKIIGIFLNYIYKLYSRFRNVIEVRY